MPTRPPDGDFWPVFPADANAFADVASPFADPRFLALLERLEERWETHTFSAVARDGARASVSLARRGWHADSLPFGYGGIAADRALEEHEVNRLLRLIAKHLAVRTVRSRYIPLPSLGRPAHGGGTVVAPTAVAILADTFGTGEELLTKRARQSVRRAERARVHVSVGTDPSRFLDVYADASRRFSTVYPTALIEHIGAVGVGRFYDALIGDEVVASACALTGKMEWMYWLAAQTARGRSAEAGYPVVARLLDDARAAGARYVNLGASVGLPGVASFKRRITAVELPVIDHTVAMPRASFFVRGARRRDGGTAMHTARPDLT